MHTLILSIPWKRSLIGLRGEIFLLSVFRSLQNYTLIANFLVSPSLLARPQQCLMPCGPPTRMILWFQYDMFSSLCFEYFFQFFIWIHHSFWFVLDYIYTWIPNKKVNFQVSFTCFTTKSSMLIELYIFY